MSPGKAKRKKEGANYLSPKEKDKWSCEGLFDAVCDLSESFSIAFALLSKNIFFAQFRKSRLKPWIGQSAPQKVVILWDARPMDPAAVLSWRCGLIEESNIAYKFLFLPQEQPVDWHKWLKKCLNDWTRPAPEKEKTGIKVGDLVYYNKDSNLNQLVDYDPAFLTISPLGKMTDVLEQLDECKRRFRKAIGKKVKERRERVHEILEQALAVSDDARREDFKNVSERLHKVIIKQQFMVGRNDLPKVLLLGPSSVGKTLVARYLAWRTSPGPGDELSRPFKRVPVPEYLQRESDFEYDVFGNCAGAFTGAHKDGKKGFLLERMGGVVFFDEIGDASPAIQAKLLAYLDDYQVTPRGWSGEPVFCPMLVVAATNRPIDEWAEKDSGKSPGNVADYFRNDLFRRFNYLIHIPSLNDRREELPFILDTMLQMPAFNQDGKIREVGANALKKLKEFDYTRGNFRDLENMVRNACRQAVRDGRRYLVEKDMTCSFQ